MIILYTRKPRHRGQVTLLLSFNKWQQPNTRALNYVEFAFSENSRSERARSFVVVEGYLDGKLFEMEVMGHPQVIAQWVS